MMKAMRNFMDRRFRCLAEQRRGDGCRRCGVVESYVEAFAPLGYS
jgi:hypothetical protein